jgi:hypothetical protein
VIARKTVSPATTTPTTGAEGTREERAVPWSPSPSGREAAVT